ncbi:MAG: flavin reductase [Ruminococcus sp.]|nr:flavin reductase [Ruminococcus sp.]
MGFKEIDIKELEFSPFEKIGKQWMLITAGNKEAFNTMTASWGGLGVLWNKNVAFTFIRPSRYTFEFCEKEEYFTLTFFSEEYRKALSFCGTKSGRDVDKCKETGLTPVFDAEAPYFEEAELVLVCKKLYAQDMDKVCVVDDAVLTNYGEDEPMHRMYVGEIVKAFTR